MCAQNQREARSSFSRASNVVLLALILLMTLVCEDSALAIDRALPLAQLHHSSWTARDGLRGFVSTIEQTQDGFLWVATSEGLFRFDGFSFEAYRPLEGEFPATVITTLCPANDGLWIGYQNGGVSFLKNGIVRNYTEADGLPISRVRMLVVDHDGILWVAAVGGMARLENGRWHRIRTDWNFPARSAGALYVDHDGTLWAASEGRLYFLKRGSRKFYDTGMDVGKNVNHLAQTPDGSFWYVDRATDDLTVANTGIGGAWSNRPVLETDVEQVWIDRDGSVWLNTKTGDGLSRVSIGADTARSKLSQTNSSIGLQVFTSRDGLTGKSIDSIFEDREGNIWIGTEGGVDRFRRRNLWWFPVPQGTQDFGLLAKPDGDVWGAPQVGPLYSLKTGKPIPKSPVNFRRIGEDRSGRVWLDSTDRIVTWSAGRFQNFVVPEEISQILPVTSRDPVHFASTTTDKQGRLWIAIGGRGEFYVEDGQWHHVPFRPDHPDWAPNAAFGDSEGSLWFANDTHLTSYKDGKSRIFDGDQGPHVGPIVAIGETLDTIVIGGELGASLFHDGEFYPLLPARVEGFGKISNILYEAGRGIWLVSSRGIVFVTNAEISNAIKQRGYRVKCDILDLVSDLPDQLNGAIRTDNAVIAADGTLWFSTWFGFAKVIPPLVRDPHAPPVAIKGIVADDQIYSPYAYGTLPALTHNIRFDFTALTLSRPEASQFSYRLEGFDRDWSTPGASRRTTYTNLGPGEYKFHVIAANADGVWNRTGATFVFKIKPAWYQTSWFLIACILIMISLVWCGHRIRLRQVASTLNARFDVRLEERTRIARDLHDTLLQTIQGSKLVADHALEVSVEDSPLRRTMEMIAGWLEEATREGRAVLTALNQASTGAAGLSELFKGAMEECRVFKDVPVEINVTGTERVAHPLVRDDIYLIGYEALRNAFLHSNASHIALSIDYECKQIRVSIRDNGRGIEPKMLENGRPGHFGLTSMRGRARRIDASLTISARPGSGTEVLLIVPT